MVTAVIAKQRPFCVIVMWAEDNGSTRSDVEWVVFDEAVAISVNPIISIWSD